MSVTWGIDMIVAPNLSRETADRAAGCQVVEELPLALGQLALGRGGGNLRAPLIDWGP